MASILGSAAAEEALMMVEAHSGKVLIANNSTVKRPVASQNSINQNQRKVRCEGRA